jgi:hypothetical protein
MQFNLHTGTITKVSLNSFPNEIMLSILMWWVAASNVYREDFPY